MAKQRSRRWKDRDGTEWAVVYNPGVELDTRRDRAVRERIVFRGPMAEYHAPAVYGSDLYAMGRTDLQGLLDQARREQNGDASAWGDAAGRKGRGDG